MGGNVAAPVSPTNKYVGLKWFPTSRPIPFPWCLEWCGKFGYDTQWRWRWRPYVRGFRNEAPTQPYGMWAFVVCRILKIIIAYGVNYTQWFSSPALLHKSSNKPSENVLAAFCNFEKSVCWGLKSRLDTGGNVAAPMSPTKKYVGLKWFPTSRPIPFPWCQEWCGMFGCDTQWRWRWRPYVRGFSNVAHHVGIELVDVHVQGTIKARECGQRGDHKGRPNASGWCRGDIVLARWERPRKKHTRPR
jgi:hypothetical protein